jgi:hypothetical protein
MWFLVKCAFWLSIVVMVLPTPEGERRADAAQVSAAEAASVLTTALADARGFCSRNPDACTTGAQALQTFGEKAQNGARMLHDFISEQLAQSRHLSPPPGSRARSGDRPAIEGQDTLTPRDLEPAWRAPAPALAARGG